jgi:uncharacterized membrane protein YesL
MPSKRWYLRAADLFHATELVCGYLAVSLMLFSAYQGWDRTIVPLLASRFRIAIVLLGIWIFPATVSFGSTGCMIWRGSAVIGALTLGTVFLRRPPNRRSTLLSG